ncbi:MAG TPA: hypothetical protein VNT75_01480 [Symbiobacteriaceae bacterium]|nr:hypothetical protein [Symbiobacteriaceae bacterium]
MKKALLHGAAVLVGLLPGFFLALNTVFSDTGSGGEYLLALVILALVYGVLGGIFGYFSRAWQSGLWLGLPAVALVALYTVSEGQLPLINVAVVAVTLLAGCGGAHAAARIRSR